MDNQTLNQEKRPRGCTPGVVPDSGPAVLASLSHELRTPLNSLLMLAKLLAENDTATMTPKQVEYARAIHSAGEDLLGLITSIVDFSRVEAGRLELHPARVPLSDFVDYVDAKFRPLAGRRGMRLEVRLAGDATGAVQTDAARVQQVLDNLVFGALTSARSDLLRIQIGSGRTPEDPGCAAVTFTISDPGTPRLPGRGTGIFPGLARAEPAEAMQGRRRLGLKLSHALAQLLGGTLRVEGTSATFYLPAVDDRQAAHSPVQQCPESEPGWLPAVPERLRELLAGKRVLAVEDDARNLFALTCLLERCGAKVMPASTAQEAFAILDRPVDPDLVLLDLMLPGMDGFQAMHAIRRRPRHARVPIIGLGVHESPVQQAGKRKGRAVPERSVAASAVLTKPLEMPALQRALAELLPA